MSLPSDGSSFVQQLTSSTPSHHLRYGSKWADMLKDPEIGKFLRGRNNVQLKDRARIERKGGKQ